MNGLNEQTQVNRPGCQTGHSSGFEKKMQNQLLFSISLWGLWGLLSTYGVTLAYRFISEPKNWTEAQRYCRDHYTDLATVSSLEEAARLEGRGKWTGQAWIGLYDDPASWKRVMTNDSNSWRWSATGTTSPGGYQHWGGDAPNHRDIREKCVHIADGSWQDYPCSNNLYFVCSTGKGAKKTFQAVKSKASWVNAVARCRANNLELAVIESSAENSEVTSLVASFSNPKAWIGLYREPWRWSDNTPVHFTNWRSVWDDIRGLHCVAETSDHLWSPADCDVPRPFFCQGEVKEKKVMKIQFRSGLDLSDPRINKMILQKIQEQLDKAGQTGVKVSWKTPPKKKKNKSEL